MPRAEPPFAAEFGISRVGAVRLLSKRSIPEPSLARCDTAITGIRATIPTLMQVRWTRRVSRTDTRSNCNFVP